MLAYPPQVQVQRRETERQAEQRLASFAHISQTEADEKWKMLDYASPDSEVASGVWENLMKPPQQAASLASMPCAEYLSTLTAGRALPHQPLNPGRLQRCVEKTRVAVSAVNNMLHTDFYRKS